MINIITAQEFNKFTSENISARLALANLANKSDVVNFAKKTDFDDKLKNAISNKNELNELWKKFEAISIKELAKKFDK